MKNIVAPPPRKLTCVNSVASARSSGGVCMSTSTGSASSGPPIVMRMLAAADSSVPVATERLTAAWSFAPYACAVGIANPLVMPQAKPSSRNSRLPVAPTAASEFTPSSRPTTIVSTTW